MGGCCCCSKSAASGKSVKDAVLVDHIVAPGRSPPAGKAGVSAGKRRCATRFQILLQGKWRNYNPKEDQILKQAYLVGQPNARYALRGQTYEYSFTQMRQVNLGSGRERQIRPPLGLKPPMQPLLPPGPIVVVPVPADSAGTTIDIKDPNNEGQRIKVNVAPGAKEGQRMVVPVPEPGQSVEAVQAKQAKHSAGAKLAMGVGGLGMLAGGAVAGVVAAAHLSEDCEEPAEAGGEWTGDAGEPWSDWDDGAGDFDDGAGDFFDGVGDDVGGGFDDVGGCPGFGGEDIADVVVDLF